MTDRVHELAQVWRKMVSTDHHKHKDGYFFISKSWSYDHSAKYHAEHDAYIGEDLFGPYRDTYAEAEADLITHIIKQIKEQERWALGVMSMQEDDRWSEREAEWMLKVISENAELIKGREQVSDLPDYHCPDCRDLNCLHCFCAEPTVCETCKAFREGAEVSEDKITLKIDSVDKLTEHWIAEGERIATERIIKLLEEQIETHEYYAAIELIKGEK